MSDIEARSIYQLEESDDTFWDTLQEISERLEWEPGQTLKACFALGWDLLSHRASCMQKDINDDKEKLE